MAEQAPPVNFPGAPPQEAEIAGAIVRRLEHWEQGVGVPFHEKCDRFYQQYRGFKQWEDEWTKAGPNDRDGYVREAQKKWGAKLHIPLSYRTIETVVPRAIAHAPKLIYSARDEQWIENVVSVRMLIDAQQQRIDIDLPFQDVMRTGHINGLGAGKTWWDRKVRMRRRMQQRTFPLPEKVAAKRGLNPTHYFPKKPEEDVYFDDPRFESLDIYDFMWDPYGYDIPSCDWTAQRMWMTLQNVIENLAQNGGLWDSASAASLDEDAIRKLPTSGGRYDEVWSRRMQASGFNTGNFSEHGEQIHEAIEYHDGHQVFTILDRRILVRQCENPCGEMPFQIYRPTPLSKQMVGIGALEPLEHLQRELDTLRSQRRDLVTLALCAGYAYDTNMLGPDDLNFGPASAIGIDGDPRSALMPLTPREVPGAGFEEESSIRTDFEAVSGLADALDNSPGGQSSTATEAQLVQAALGRRIELGARRFEIEVVRNVARQFLYLDQREIRKQRTEQIPGQPEAPPDPDGSRTKFFQIGPGELEGEIEIEVEGGSMAARNIPQDRADAQMWMNMLAGDYFTDPTKVRLKVYELLGAKHPHAYLRSQQPTIPMATLRLMIQMGVDPAIVQRARQKALEIEAPGEEASQQPAPMSAPEGAQAK